jgi:hypothetical protein
MARQDLQSGKFGSHQPKPRHGSRKKEKKKKRKKKELKKKKRDQKG